MNCKLLYFFLLFIFSYNIYSQTTYFIKYNDAISKNEIEEKINSKQIFSSSESLRKINNNFNVNFFAKGLGKVDERLSRIVKVTFQNETDAETFFSIAQSDNTIEYVQAANTYHVDYIPNDSLINEQWALEKIGAYNAWDITQGSDTILVSIIDTGIDYLHPDLKNQIFINEGEIPDNNIDDDSNGFIDDWRGWDFTDRVGFPFDTTGGDFLGWDNDPMDGMWHGTAVAGVIGAETNNNTGIAGVAPNVKLLCVRSFDPNGLGDEDDAAAAILYSVLIGANVINMSWGDYSFSYVLRDVIRYAHSQNVILVASSGNYPPAPTVTELHYPSGYDEVISVGNSTINDGRASSSVYGSTIDLVAPGTDILLTNLNAGYRKGDGTSFSAPHVSAAASLILSLNNFTNEEVKQIIKSTCDDIQSAGWDIQTGAGRLNLFRALSVLSPAKIKFNFPIMDYGTNGNSIEINATVLSPYFVSYNLEVGLGEIPSQWIKLIENGQNQFSNEAIYNLDISTYSDAVYTLRLIVIQNNGNTIEERINFHIMRTPPELIEVGSGPIYYGDKSTIGAEFYTNQKSIVRLYYKKITEPEFRFITLDGFNTNNQFVKQFHYGFVPKDLISPNTDYEVYYEAENLAGLKTVLLDTLNSDYFKYTTNSFMEPVNYSVLDFSLPKGTLFENPVNFLSNGNNEVLFDLFYTPKNGTTYSLYTLNGNTFNKFEQDSLINKIPRAVGDYNTNGKVDLISSFSNDGFLDEQKIFPGFSFNNFKTDTLKRFHAILIDDIDNDGRTEVLADSADHILIYRIKNDLSLQSLGKIRDTINADSFDSNYEFRNLISRNAITADLNNDGINEIWFSDADGDLISYNVGENSFTLGNYILTNFRDLNEKTITKGDYDGDGIEDIAIIYSTNSIAPNIILLVFNFKNNQLNVIYEKIFVDQSEEFIGFTFRVVNYSLKMEDIDNDNQSELIVNIFPYSYIFKRYGQTDKLIFFKEGTNNEYTFSGDLNQNGIKEVAFQDADGYHFYEFGLSVKAIPPVNVKGFSIDSSTIHLSWEGTGDRFRIFKGIDSLQLFDSTISKIFTDNQIENGITYNYAVQSFDASKQDPYSKISNIIQVYTHNPARIISIENNSPHSLIVTFSERVKTSIDNLKAFEIMNFGFPNSVSPSNQYSYLLTFNKSLTIGINNLIVKDMNDFYGSPVKTDTVQFNVQPIETDEEFFVSSFEIINPFRIKLQFNFNVDETTALVKENYSFEPENHVESIEIDNSDTKVIYLNLDGKKPIGSIGREYRLRILNLKSSGGISINSGAGSYVVLTSFAKDLSDVYVYPNPANVDKGKLTFANLPKKAKIIIFNLNGDRITEIEESDGNGGVDFNLSYESGEKLNSGIYIFRIVMLDDSNNEVDEKIGKFAVVR